MSWRTDARQHFAPIRLSTTTLDTSTRDPSHRRRQETSGSSLGRDTHYRGGKDGTEQYRGARRGFVESTLPTNVRSEACMTSDARLVAVVRADVALDERESDLGGCGYASRWVVVDGSWSATARTDETRGLLDAWSMRPTAAEQEVAASGCWKRAHGRRCRRIAIPVFLEARSNFDQKNESVADISIA